MRSASNGCWLDPSNRAIAIERDPVRAGRIARNAAALGVPDLSIVTGTAPDALQGLPAPDAVFIGGGATDARRDRAGVDRAAAAAAGWSRTASRWKPRPNCSAGIKTLGGTLRTIQIAHADALGRFHAMRPAMPVTQWSVTKP